MPVYLWRGGGRIDHKRGASAYLPDWSDGDVDGLAGEKVPKEGHRPHLGGLPAGSGASDYEGGVPGDIAHELERTRLLVEFGDGGAVELVPRRDKLRNRVSMPIIHFSWGGFMVIRQADEKGTGCSIMQLQVSARHQISGISPLGNSRFSTYGRPVE